MRLETDLTRQTQQILCRQQAVDAVTLRRLHAEAHLKFVVPTQLLLVVEVGLHDRRAKHAVVALTTFIPVRRDVVLHELQVIISRERPEIRTTDKETLRRELRFTDTTGRDNVNDVRMRLQRLTVLLTLLHRGADAVQLPLTYLHEVGMIDIDRQKETVDIGRQR